MSVTEWLNTTDKETLQDFHQTLLRGGNPETVADDLYVITGYQVEWSDLLVYVQKR